MDSVRKEAKPWPLASCIMPTYNRREFVPKAIRYFLCQNYANKELIIIDDGTDEISDLVPQDEQISYFRLNQKLTLGAKLNLACQYAKGAIIAHWDDDDWYAPGRLAYQVESLLNKGTDVCGVNNLLYYDLCKKKSYRYCYPNDQRTWLSGSSLCYTKKIWAETRFADIDVGMDALFVWAIPSDRVSVLSESKHFVFMMHEGNVSPKKADGPWWQEIQSDEIIDLMGHDWDIYQTGYEGSSSGLTPRIDHSKQQMEKPARSIHNIYACLVHENKECIIDLVRNLKYHDSTSTILLYNGGKDKSLLNNHFPFERHGAMVHPSPRQMKWGWLHGFALDCMQFALDNFSFDTLTIVDSDQLAIRSGLSDYLGQFLVGKSNLGMLGNAPYPQPASTNINPAAQALKEIDLWRPFLKRFTGGEEKFVHWTFWPSTVFLYDSVKDLARLFATDTTLQNTLGRSQIWASEEVILPTLVALLGYKIAMNPCSYDYVKYLTPFSVRHVDTAMTRDDVFWIHPVSRRYDDSIRMHIRSKFSHYVPRSPEKYQGLTYQRSAHSDLFLIIPILKTMNKVSGWFDEEEADLLIAAAQRALAKPRQSHALVEIGSYCGRSTVVLGSVVRAKSPESKVYAIDPHNGKLGALDQGIQLCAPTLEAFRRNIRDAGLEKFVELIQSHSFDVHWDKPISLIFIDGLHDYPSVARDFWHFAKWIRPGGIAAFHDYADYYPGVKSFVDELINRGDYQLLKIAKSLAILEKGRTEAA